MRKFVLILLLSWWPAHAMASHVDNLLQEGVAKIRTSDPVQALVPLKKAHSMAKGREKAKTGLALAQAHSAAGNYSEAIEILNTQVLKTIPKVLKELALWELANAQAKAGQATAGDSLQSFINQYPRSQKANLAKITLGRIYLDQEMPAQATNLAQLVLTSSPSRLDKAEAILLKALASPPAQQEKLFKELFIEMPDTFAAGKTGLTEEQLDDQELDARAQAFFNAKDYEEAMRIHTAIYNGGDKTGKRALTLGRLHLIHLRDDGPKALAYLEQARSEGALSGPESHILMARAYAKVEDYEKAEAEYRAYLNTGATASRVRAMYYLGWLPYDHGEYERAIPEFDRFLAAYPKDKQRSYILWFKGWSLYQLKRYEEAITTFERMVPLGNNLVAGKAMYWAGKAHKELNNNAEALRWMQLAVDKYPLSYYAVLAAMRLNEWNNTKLPIWMTGPAMPAPKPWWPFERLKPGLRAKLQEVKDLGDLGQTRTARAKYQAISNQVERALSTKDKARFLLTVADATGDYNGLFKKARKDFGSRFGPIPTQSNSLYWMARYPKAERPLAQVLAKRFNMPELWTYAIMRQESRYDARQVSHTAALGIMQMIPATAKIVSKALGVPFHVETFFDTGPNVLFCMYYLSELLKDFKGQILFASAAYNSGAPAIKRFMHENKGLPFDEMVESIPYNEGRNYARKVAEHLTRYAYMHLKPVERKALYKQLFPVSVDYDLGTSVNY